MVTVKSAGKRIKKYRSKLELPNPGQVYHTVLKVVKCYEFVDYQVNPGCMNYLEYVVLNFGLSYGLGVVARGVLVRVVRHAFADFLENKKVSSDTKRKCYRWLSWLDNYVDICYNFWNLIESVLPDCTKISCLPDDTGVVSSEIHERVIRLKEVTIDEGSEIHANT